MMNESNLFATKLIFLDVSYTIEIVKESLSLDLQILLHNNEKSIFYSPSAVIYLPRFSHYVFMPLKELPGNFIISVFLLRTIFCFG